MRRDDFPLKMSRVVTFIKKEYVVWTVKYLASSKESIRFRLLQRFIHRHGYSFRRPTRAVLSSEDLRLEQEKFSSEVGAAIAKTYARGCVFNADETAVYYDEEPGCIIAERGFKKPAKVRGRARSSCASVLLVVSVTGKRLRPIIIFKGQPGGTMEEECKGYKDIYVTVQKNAWMDARIWHDHFVNGLWAEFFFTTQAEPLALYVDNMKCHTSDASTETFASWGTELVSLPKNTTAVLQPLDVGVMGPFKEHLRAIALSYQLSCIQTNRNLPLRERLLALMKVPASEKRKIVVARVVKAWENVSEDCICRAWEKVGL